MWYMELMMKMLMLIEFGIIKGHQLDNFVKSLPNRLETKVGENGVRLSEAKDKGLL